MRKSNTESLSNILKNYIQENKLEPKLTEIDLINSWKTVVGDPVFRYTKNLYIKNQTLFVETTSSIVRTELLMMKEELRARLNETVGQEIVKAIVFR